MSGGFSWIQVGRGRVQITHDACGETFYAEPYAMRVKVDKHRCRKHVVHAHGRRK